MAPTKSAGRVSIRVLPDSTRFREDLKKTLDRIERSVKAEIPVHLKLSREQIRALKEELDKQIFQIKPMLMLNQRRLQEVKKQIEALDATINADIDLNTRGAAARIANLTRARQVPVFVTVMATNFGKHLAALGGLGFIAEEVNRGLKYLREIDKNSVILARQALLFGSVIAAVGSATQAVLGLGDGIIKTVGILSVAPALVSSIGIAVAVFASVLRDLKTVLADLGPQFTQLRSTMSATFWGEAAGPIREMVNTLFPTMAEQINESSRAMGRLTGQLAKSYQFHVTPERLALMWGRVNESMYTVIGAVDPIIEAFTTLGLHGTKYLNRLSKSIVKLSEDFNNFIQTNDANGNLDKWTEEAIQAFKDLGGIIKGVWNVFGALNTAAKAAGGPTLATLHRNLDNLATLMDSPRFQKALVHVFRGMNTGIREILAGVGEMGKGMSTFAPTVEKAFVQVGSAVRTLLRYLGQILDNPIFNKGVGDLFQGLREGIEGLGPAVEPTAVALGSLFTLMGHLLKRLGGLIGTIMEKWGPSLQRLSDEFDTLVDPVMDFVEALVIGLTPAIETLIDEAIIPLLGWIRDDLLPIFTKLAKENGPELEVLFSSLGRFIVALLPILTWLITSFLEVVGAISEVVFALVNFQETMLDPSTSPIVEFGKLVGAHIGVALWHLRTLAEYLTTEFLEKWNAGFDSIERRIDSFQLMFSQDWEVVAAVMKMKLEEMGFSFDSFGAFVLSVWDMTGGELLSRVSIKMAEVHMEYKTKLDAMGVDTSTVWTTITSAVGIATQTVLETVSKKSQEIKENWNTKLAEIALVTAYGWEEIKRTVMQKFEEMKAGASEKGRELVDTLRGLPEDIRLLFALDWSQVGAAIIQGIIDGMWSMLGTAVTVASYIVQRIRDLFPFSPAKTGPFSGKGYTSHSGSAMIRDWAGGMKKEMSYAKNVASKVMGNVQGEFGEITSAAEGAESTTSGNVTMNVYNPVREPTSRTIAKTAAEIRLGGAIG